VLPQTPGIALHGLLVLKWIGARIKQWAFFSSGVSKGFRVGVKIDYITQGD
jgi:hypothetical protein